MRIKIINHLLLFANILFIFGLVISIILINKTPSEILGNKVIINYIPFIVFMLLSLTCATLFAYFRKNYFILIKSHLSKRSITLFKSSVFLLFANLIICIVMLFAGLAFFANENLKEINFFKNVYLYIILGIEMLLTMVDVGVDSIAKLKVKVDLAIKRSGTQDFLNEGKNE